MGRRKDGKYLNETAARSLIPKAYTAQWVLSEVAAHSHVNHFDLESKSKIELDQFWTTLGDRPRKPHSAQLFPGNSFPILTGGQPCCTLGTFRMFNILKEKVFFEGVEVHPTWIWR